MERMYDNRVIAEFMRIFIMWWMMITNFHKPRCWPRPINCDINNKRCFIGFTYHNSKGIIKVKNIWNNDDFHCDNMQELFNRMKKVWE